MRAEIDRRLAALRTEHPAARRREALERDLTRASAAIERLIEAYQEQLISLDELRARMPTLRKRQTTLHAQLDSARRRAARRRDLPASSPTRSKGSSAASPTAWTSSTSTNSSASCDSSSAKS